MYKVGIDIGSTTLKLAVTDEAGVIVYSKYKRHCAKAREVLIDTLQDLSETVGDVDMCAKITGTVGMGISEQYDIPFVQEVVAAARAVKELYPSAQSMIDIGGEDAKIVFFKDGEVKDLRMNGNCAGGTGAFIEQMAVILGVGVDDLNTLALNSNQIYPIASRCGVFCKTDIQNLVANNVSRENIAASIFHAVAVQTIITLAHGFDIKPPILLCGGPLTLIPALRKAFVDYLKIKDTDLILPQNGTQLPALGATLFETGDEPAIKLSSLIRRLKGQGKTVERKSVLSPIFTGEDDYKVWKKRISEHGVKHAELKPGRQDVYLGIDSGSTTTKIVVTDKDANLIYTFYNTNDGNPIDTVERGLRQLADRCRECGAELNICGSCSTGYGEDLIKAAFRLDNGIVETIAHYMAAHYLAGDVSFILDIGGQDMKAIFVNDGVIDRIEINEACSSGCGSFIETFAKTLGYKVADFAAAACRAVAPCDLGSRCTVFMNSKVKQVLREGATVEDIAAGLAYSVIKNCLYKVLKLKDGSELGKKIVVQGGTMRNDAIVRALELLTGAEVMRCDCPELMGAFGCALYAARRKGEPASLDEIISKASYTTRKLHCHGCDNQCLVSCYNFENGKKYYSGNRCEKVFTNGEKKAAGQNAYKFKYDLLFGRAEQKVESPLMTIGIPRCLNMYEDFPFWHTLFTDCGIQVCLSDASDFAGYERCARMVMSDNICFPAKLVHSHIESLAARKVDRIFMPFVIFEKQGDEQNCFNCPVVTGYSEVIKSVQGSKVPVDSPAISFKNKKLLLRQCTKYLSTLGVDDSTVEKAFRHAVSVEEHYASELAAHNKAILNDATMAGRFTVMLAGRPYHTDPLIQHRISYILAEMGFDVISEDIVRNEHIDTGDSHFLDQWSYPNRILKAAKWCAMQGGNVQFIEMTSFGCGPDAFLVDEIRDMLLRNGKSLTLLKLDDINNVGSMKLRIRSLIESIRLSQAERDAAQPGGTAEFKTTPIYDKTFRDRKIIIPYFTPFISPLIPAIMRYAGYDVDNLPLSNTESCEWGLKFANNEVCYPATLIVGDVIKAFKSGKYDPDRTVVAMTQTGGQCRASNYVAMIKKALVEAGYAGTPVISLTLGSTIRNEQPGFRINWLKVLPVALRAILYSDSISKFYYASVARENKEGEAARLRDKYLKLGEKLISQNKSKEMFGCLADAAREFNGICLDRECRKVGVVGEIFLKFNPFAQKNVIDWLIGRGIEVVPSVLTDFFMQAFVNRKVRVKSYIEKSQLPEFVYNLGYKIVSRQIDEVNRICSAFRYFLPFRDIFAEADEARSVISLNAQFGEGWLLPAEIMSYYHYGVRNVVSLQPFGCIANHIVSKGIEKRIRLLLPQINILSLDFDSGVSEVNIINRMLLFIDNLK